MAGLQAIVKQMLVRCPHCNRPLDLGEFTAVLFDRILETLAQGERVFIPQFGTFRSKFMKGWTIKTYGEERDVPGRNVIRFRAAANAKKCVNPDLEESNDEGDDDPEPKSKAKERKAAADKRSDDTKRFAKAAGAGAARLLEALKQGTEKGGAAGAREPSPDGRAVTFANPTRARRKARRGRNTS